MIEQVDEIRKLLSVKEVSEILGCTDWLTRQLIYRGELVSTKVGRLERIHPADLARYLKRSKRRVE